MSFSIWNFKEAKMEPCQLRCCWELRHWEILGQACATAVFKRHLKPINFKFWLCSSDFPFYSEEKVTRQEQQTIIVWLYEKIEWILFVCNIVTVIGLFLIIWALKNEFWSNESVWTETERESLKLRPVHEWDFYQVTCSWLCYCLASSFNVCAPSHLAEISMQEKMHQSQQLKWLHLTCWDSWVAVFDFA